MIIDCGSCAVAGDACNDCVVTVLLGPVGGLSTPVADGPLGVSVTTVTEAASAEIPDEHADAVALLAETGLIPPLRLVPRAS